MRILRKAILGLTIAAAAVSGASATASDGYSNWRGGYDSCHAPSYSLRKVTTWEIVRKPCRVKVYSYDHCGDLVYTWKTVYKTVKVPVVKWVKVL